MIDREIVNFYNSVKDPQWPDVKNYLDFCRLPAEIKIECDDLHGFQERKSMIEDSNYWVVSTLDVCVYKNLAFVPIPKCAYIYYITLFLDLGWEMRPLHTIDIESTKFFGVMMHPETRWIKGMNEWLTRLCLSDTLVKSVNPAFLPDYYKTDWEQLRLLVKTPFVQKLISEVLVGDTHTAPYSIICGDLLNKTHWIPMDILTDDEAKIRMMEFFQLHNHDISLPLNHARLHVSAPVKLEIFNHIKSLCFKNQEQLYNFYKLFGTDLKFYNNLIKKTCDQ